VKNFILMFSPLTSAWYDALVIFRFVMVYYRSYILASLFIWKATNVLQHNTKSNICNSDIRNLHVLWLLAPAHWKCTGFPNYMVRAFTSQKSSSAEIFWHVGRVSPEGENPNTRRYSPAFK